MTQLIISLDNSKDVLYNALMSIYTKDYFIVCKHNELQICCFDDFTYFQMKIGYFVNTNLSLYHQTNDEVSKLLKDILKKKTSSLEIIKSNLGSYLNYKRTSKDSEHKQITLSEKELPKHILEIEDSPDNYVEVCVFNSENVDIELAKVNTLTSEFDIFEFRYTSVLISELALSRFKRSVSRFPTTLKLLKYPGFYRITSIDYMYNFYFLPVLRASIKVEKSSSSVVSEE